MKLSYRARPGAGFGIFVAVVVASTAFFSWGWRRPPLDEVWQIQLELLLGTRPALASDERHLLQDTLRRYPLLAANMLEDAASGLISAHVGGAVDLNYAYVVRQTADAPGVLRITSLSGAPLELMVCTTTAEITGEASGAVPFEWTLPDAGPFPQLAEVRIISEPRGDGTAKKGKDHESRRIRPMLVEVRSAKKVDG